ncbi:MULTISPECIES: queuosine precursor transporter [Bacillaceae]|uniref:Probable queuosine precursor transporter n=1 Tax=Evansella alkalicola TaxID=745819 RepID=A0ABS6JNA3_9BACI|nr:MULTISPECIES: queuosine precursor transporter [Bacillaceae]MBU9719958.1 queuosine precursor transporter [Bacillus alkalicola]
MNNYEGFNESKQFKLILLCALFFTALLVSNVISAKLFSIGSIVLTAGIITYPLTFLITDSISEVYGKATAKRVVIYGLLSNVMMIGFFYFAITLPPAGYWPMQAEFEAILGAVPRMVAASLIAYSISQLWDVHLFHKLKEMTKGKHLWLRNNGSTLTSQLVDSCIFVFIAFYGTMPLPALFAMIGTQYLVKIGFALADTPFIYLTVKWLNGNTSTKQTTEEATAHVS